MEGGRGNCQHIPYIAISHRLINARLLLNQFYSASLPTLSYLDYFDFIDPSVIVLTEQDVSDPTVNVVPESICSYPLSHLQDWLVYRGDTLKGIANLQDARVRVLEFISLGTDKRLIDPTPDKKWLRRKALMMGLTLMPKEINLPSLPDGFIFDFSNLHNMDGWTKTLEGIPQFSVNSIETYAEKITAAVDPKCKSVKRHFSRGEQFLEENFLDISSIHSKQSDKLFCLKGVCAASMKKKDRVIFIAMNKNDASVSYSFCQCPAGKAGTCFHAFALMKLVAKWMIDKKRMFQSPRHEL